MIRVMVMRVKDCNGDDGEQKREVVMMRMMK